jgi:hypothetical protein
MARVPGDVFLDLAFIVDRRGAELSDNLLAHHWPVAKPSAPITVTPFGFVFPRRCGRFIIV